MYNIHGMVYLVYKHVDHIDMVQLEYFTNLNLAKGMISYLTHDDPGLEESLWLTPW